MHVEKLIIFILILFRFSKNWRRETKTSIQWTSRISLRILKIHSKNQWTTRATESICVSDYKWTKKSNSNGSWKDFLSLKKLKTISWSIWTTRSNSCCNWEQTIQKLMPSNTFLTSTLFFFIWIKLTMTRKIYYNQLLTKLQKREKRNSHLVQRLRVHRSDATQQSLFHWGFLHSLRLSNRKRWYLTIFFLKISSSILKFLSFQDPLSIDEYQELLLLICSDFSAYLLDDCFE